MEPFKIAVVQMNALRDALEHNLRVHERITAEAADAGCQLVMFPELSVTAHYGEEDVTMLAEAACEGTIYDTMRRLTVKHGIVIGYGFCEKAHGTFYNAYGLMAATGLIGVQRKVHASLDEYLSFRMGRSFEVFNLGFCKVGVLICFDAGFFEAWRVMALKGVDVVLLPHAGRSGMGEAIAEPEQRQHLQQLLDRLPGRYGVYADDNNVFAAYGNQVGYNGHSTHSGSAYVCGPDGNLLAQSEACLGDLWISAELDPHSLEQARKSKYSVMRTRRPEVYQELTMMI